MVRFGACRQGCLDQLHEWLASRHVRRRDRQRMGHNLQGGFWNNYFLPVHSLPKMKERLRFRATALSSHHRGYTLEHTNNYTYQNNILQIYDHRLCSTHDPASLCCGRTSRSNCWMLKVLRSLEAWSTLSMKKVTETAISRACCRHHSGIEQG